MKQERLFGYMILMLGVFFVVVCCFKGFVGDKKTAFTAIFLLIPFSFMFFLGGYSLIMED